LIHSLRARAAPAEVTAIHASIPVGADEISR